MTKRILDFIISGIGLIIFLPILLLIYLLVLIKIGRPVFFIQQRPGINGIPFNIIKFRTMNNKVDNKNKLLSDMDRLSKFGTWLRSYSLDELPELLNVFKGDMSLVGPRPLLMEYLNLYSKTQSRRMEMKPGITGWAQINGRNDISWEDKFSLDIWYIDNWSLWLDIKILLITIMKVIGRSGINAKGDATMKKFKGYQKNKNKSL